MKRVILATVLCGLALTGWTQGNGKKVYADYHGVRFTRPVDGKTGRWSYYADTQKSSTGRLSLCYNADLVDESGRHEIASVNYPLVGMQSNLDPDYLEYQILSAKAAGIDGFFIEWGFMGHENDGLLKAMQREAAKYDFEVGVNWCDGWLYYDWITKMHPEINSRGTKTEHLAKCYQYLIDSVFTGKTAPMVKGRPVFYLFGPGATPAEWKKAASEVKLPAGMQSPAVLRRWADWGKLENDNYIPVTTSSDIEQWKALGMIPTAWLPARVREKDATYPYWDNYALGKDVIAFMEPFRDQIWRSDNPAYTVRSGFVMPGMDNRGCAGWGRGHFYGIPRGDGGIYRDMWEFNMADKDRLDMVFIASWSDYTEGHEIEPTVENGDRELRTTLKYAADFKGLKADESGIALPLELFNLRKQLELIAKSRKPLPELTAKLDVAAVKISTGEYAAASALLKEVSSATAAQMPKGKKMSVREDECKFNNSARNGEFFIGDELKITLPEGVAYELTRRYYTGYLTFEYYDSDDDFLRVYSQTERQPKDLFGVVATIKGDITHEWRKARIPLYKENIVYPEGRFSFRLTGGTKVRKIGFEFETYK